MLTVSDLSKSFDHIPVIDRISFSINKGDSVGLMGKNGAGKSTLLRILSRISTPENGQIEFEKNNNLNADHSNRKGIVYVGHDPGFYPSLTGKENLQFFSALHNGNQDDDSIQKAMASYDLDGDSIKQIKYYSQGMLQRLQLSLIDIIPWSLLLIDEPFSGLDMEGIDRVKAKFSSWHNSGKTIIFVDHDLKRTIKYSTRIMVIKDQKIALDKSVQEDGIRDQIADLLN